MLFYINWHKYRLDWQLFVDKIRWADFHFDRKSGDVSDSSYILDDNLGPFKVKTDIHVPQLVRTLHSRHF